MKAFRHRLKAFNKNANVLICVCLGKNQERKRSLKTKQHETAKYRSGGLYAGVRYAL